MMLLISLILALIPMLGIVGIALYGSLTTVDGLFMALILLTIAGIFGLNALYELRKARLNHANPGRAAGKNGSRTDAAFAFPGALKQRGRVASVQFFESHVGQPNRSIVTLAESPSSFQTLVLDGDVRNALPLGQKVEVTMRKQNGLNVLLNVSYS
ncbi:MAG: hypothetical protein JOY93_09190 [Acidobacteriales bacterium]|nr:hypothetical protein [Terriglobales bacterium]